MQTREWTFIDKAVWGEGPWVGEPDKMQWQDPATGLPCLIVRNSECTGALCGYVGVPPGHPLHGKSYNDVEVSVHGGLTFADKCRPEADDGGICHVADPGEPDDVWWLGFDCAHAMDLSPHMEMVMAELRGGARSGRQIGEHPYWASPRRYLPRHSLCESRGYQPRRATGALKSQ